MSECAALVQDMELPEATSSSKAQWKKFVNQCIKKKNRQDILDTIETRNYKKLDLEELKAEQFERKSYMTDLNMQAARTKFALRTKMTKTIKLNFKNDPINKKTLWKCNDCDSIDSQEHILWCPAYGHLRTDKNLEDDKDLTRYFQQVLQLRD